MKIAPILALLALAAPGGAEPLERFNERVYVPVTVNGQRTVALLDSAAEMTILDDDFAARLGLAPTGSATAHGSGAGTMEARFADQVGIELFAITLEHRVAILDLGEVSARLLGRPVDILLGRELFDRHRLWIDLVTGWIEPASSDEPARGTRLPLGEHRGIPTIPAVVEGHGPVQAVFDLGNGGDVLVGRAFAERLGLTAPERVVERRRGGGLGGARDFDIVVLRTLTLAGREFRDVRAAIDPGETGSDLNIGTSILRHFLITTDFPNRAIWLEPRPSDRPPAPREPPAPVRIELIDSRLFLPVQVGEVRTLALVDTTARENVIDDDFARRLGVRDPDSARSEADRDPGTIEEQMMRGLETHVSVDLGLFGFGHTMPHRELGVIGATDGRPVDLMIGRELFDSLRFRIDIAGGTLGTFVGWPTGGVRLPVTDINGWPTVPVEIGSGEEAQALLDTGHGPVRMAAAFAERGGLLAALGSPDGSRIILPELGLGGRTFRDVEVVIDRTEGAPDLALGTSILRHFIVTTSFSEGEVWLEPVE